MTPAEKAAFLAFVVGDIFAPHRRISSAMFLSFGYHENFFAYPPSLSHCADVLTPTAHDDGQQAQAIILSQVVPRLAAGGSSPTNLPVFDMGIGHEGEEPTFVTESSIASMTLTLGHIFNLRLFDQRGSRFVADAQTTPVVFHDRYGMPISLRKIVRLSNAAAAGSAANPAAAAGP